GEMLAFDREVSNKFVDSLRTKLLSLGVPHGPAEEVFGSIPPTIFDLLQITKEKSFQEVVEKHEAIITKLAEVDPIFASNWSYRSRSAFPEQLRIFLTAATSASTEKNEVTDKFIEHIRDWFEAKSQKRLLTSFEKGVIEIAWRIGFRTWWNVKSGIKKWRNDLMNEIDSETNEYVFELVKFAAENQKLIQNQMHQARDVEESDRDI
ncbi:MAG: hypothetical protein HOP17_12815, partial [Acidobacteria bacterium]|nr:hypothetical protein [Acidobacteriota bacterium]